MRKCISFIILFILCLSLTGCSFNFNFLKKNNNQDDNRKTVAIEKFAKEQPNKVDKYTPAELEQLEREKTQPKEDSVQTFVLIREIIGAEALSDSDSIEGADFITKDNINTYTNYISKSSKETISFDEETWYKLKWKYSLEDRSILNILPSDAKFQELEQLLKKSLSKEEKIAINEVMPIVLKNNADKKLYVLNEKSLDLTLTNLTVSLIDDVYLKDLNDILTQATENNNDEG